MHKPGKYEEEMKRLHSKFGNELTNSQLTDLAGLLLNNSYSHHENDEHDRRLRSARRMKTVREMEETLEKAGPAEMEHITRHWDEFLDRARNHRAYGGKRRGTRRMYKRTSRTRKH